MELLDSIMSGAAWGVETNKDALVKIHRISTPCRNSTTFAVVVPAPFGKAGSQSRVTIVDPFGYAAAFDVNTIEVSNTRLTDDDIVREINVMSRTLLSATPARCANYSSIDSQETNKWRGSGEQLNLLVIGGIMFNSSRPVLGEVPTATYARSTGSPIATFLTMHAELVSAIILKSWIDLSSDLPVEKYTATNT